MPERQTAPATYKKGTTDTTRALDVYRCSECRALACGDPGWDPGKCLRCISRASKR